MGEAVEAVMTVVHRLSPAEPAAVAAGVRGEKLQWQPPLCALLNSGTLCSHLDFFHEHS